ncbi:potassium channel family protein [Streptomyces sp. MS06]|uniref:potassium channel family protein n=1 Tax=Streptomyces sp. MS06 TaxID=3385974 RepID=UPI00399F49CB
MTDPVAPGAESGRSQDAASWPARPDRRGALVALGRALAMSGGLVAAYYLLPLDRPPGADWTTAVLFGGLLVVAAVFAWEVRTIVRSPHPRLRAVEALLTTLALFLVLFATTYHQLEQSAPEAFNEPLTRTDALYFTMTTFTTVGYGDIVARSETARVVVMLQMAGGLAVFGLAARILAGAVQAGLHRQETRPSGDAGTETRGRRPGGGHRRRRRRAGHDGTR